MLFSIFDLLRFFEALQMFFFKFLLTLSWRRPLSYRNQSIDLRSKLRTGFYMITASVMKELKWGKNEEKYWFQHILWNSKILFRFWIEAYIFFQMVIFATLWKSTLKMATLFRRWLTLFNSTLKYATLFQSCWTL